MVVYIGESMIYEVHSVSVYGGSMIFEYDNKHDAKCKVRELKDLGGMFLVRVIELESSE